MFPSEPLWVDLRWAHDELHVSLRNPRFRDAVADLAAPIHGVPKDEIVGEDARQHRRTLRLAWSAGVLLLVLTVAAAIGAILAVGQRNEARDQTEIAQARELAATAVAALPSRLDIAQGLAAEAYTRRPSPQTEAALLAAVAASPHLVRFGHYPSPVSVVAPADRTGVYVGGEDGKVRRWDLRIGQVRQGHRRRPGRRDPP